MASLMSYTPLALCPRCLDPCQGWGRQIRIIGAASDKRVTHFIRIICGQPATVITCQTQTQLGKLDARSCVNFIFPLLQMESFFNRTKSVVLCPKRCGLTQHTSWLLEARADPLIAHLKEHR